MNNLFDDKYDICKINVKYELCFGGGVELNNADKSINEMSNNYNDCVKADTMEDVNVHAPSNEFTSPMCSVNRMIIKLHNIQGHHPHMLVPYGAGGHNVTSKLGENSGELNTVTLTMFYGSVLFESQMVHITHLQDAQAHGVGGFYYLCSNYEGYNYELIHCAHLPDGYSQVFQTMDCHITTIHLSRHHNNGDSNPDPRLTYDNYCKDLRSRQYYNCSHETYLETIIDMIIDNDTQCTSGIIKQTVCDKFGNNCLELCSEQLCSFKHGSGPN